MDLNERSVFISNLNVTNYEIIYLIVQTTEKTAYDLDFKRQLTCCRSLLAALPGTLVTPAYKNLHLIQLAVLRSALPSLSQLNGLLSKLGLEFLRKERATPKTFQACLRFTFEAFLSPKWNRIARWFVRGDILGSQTALEACDLEVLVTDSQLYFSMKAGKLKTYPFDVTEIGLASELLQYFVSDANAVLSLDNVAALRHGTTVHVLPTLRQALIVSISRQIPTDCPYKELFSFVEHWKCTYGLDVPNDPVRTYYVNVKFAQNGTTYCYPHWCVHSRPPFLLRRYDPGPIMQEFVRDFNGLGLVSPMTEKAYLPVSSATNASQVMANSNLNLQPKPSSCQAPKPYRTVDPKPTLKQQSIFGMLSGMKSTQRSSQPKDTQTKSNSTAHPKNLGFVANLLREVEKHRNTAVIGQTPNMNMPVPELNSKLPVSRPASYVQTQERGVKQHHGVISAHPNSQLSIFRKGEPNLVEATSAERHREDAPVSQSKQPLMTSELPIETSSSQQICTQTLDLLCELEDSANSDHSSAPTFQKGLARFAFGKGSNTPNEKHAQALQSSLADSTKSSGQMVARSVRQPDMIVNAKESSFALTPKTNRAVQDPLPLIGQTVDDVMAEGSRNILKQPEASKTLCSAIDDSKHQKNPEKNNARLASVTIEGAEAFSKYFQASSTMQRLTFKPRERKEATKLTFVSSIHKKLEAAITQSKENGGGGTTRESDTTVIEDGDVGQCTSSEKSKTSSSASLLHLMVGQEAHELKKVLEENRGNGITRESNVMVIEDSDVEQRNSSEKSRTSSSASLLHLMVRQDARGPKKVVKENKGSETMVTEDSDEQFTGSQTTSSAYLLHHMTRQGARKANLASASSIRISPDQHSVSEEGDVQSSNNLKLTMTTSETLVGTETVKPKFVPVFRKPLQNKNQVMPLVVSQTNSQQKIIPQFMTKKKLVQQIPPPVDANISPSKPSVNKIVPSFQTKQTVPKFSTTTMNRSTSVAAEKKIPIFQLKSVVNSPRLKHPDVNEDVKAAFGTNPLPMSLNAADAATPNKTTKKLPSKPKAPGKPKSIPTTARKPVNPEPTPTNQVFLNLQEAAGKAGHLAEPAGETQKNGESSAMQNGQVDKQDDATNIQGKNVYHCVSGSHMLIMQLAAGKLPELPSAFPAKSVQKRAKPDTQDSPAPKKPRAPPKVATDANVEELARLGQLSKVNAATVAAWLKAKGIAVKSKDKRKDLDDKVLQCLGISN